jgi:hypothetical protein
MIANIVAHFRKDENLFVRVLFGIIKLRIEEQIW